ncbi:hypothetical protein [Sagittula salina]|uniref:CBU-0592-like domain-containing protein n=1 Tax=Sagittula salina TaxID=2820268 RepID=A0A940MSH6_9RHOB|nr:hypothetical protein [Sagittula salina]MBP0483991.1 hypothetical protein [Sagittula salina]
MSALLATLPTDPYRLVIGAMGLLGLTLWLTAYAACALRPGARTCSATLAMNALAGVLILPASHALSPAAMALPGAWAALSLTGLALRLRRRPLPPAPIPYAALGDDHQSHIAVYGCSTGPSVSLMPRSRSATRVAA